MFEFNWEKLRDDANYVAMDNDGSWHWFSHEPSLVEGKWLSHEKWHRSGAICPNINSNMIKYTQSLIKRPSPPITYGQYFECSGIEYILAQVSPNTVGLICLVTGNRYADPVRVIDVSKISGPEWDEITANNANSFKRIEK